MKKLYLLLLVTLNFLLLNAEEIQINDVLIELPIEGNISSKGEVDTYTFTAQSSGLYTFYSTYTSDRTDVDSKLLDSNGEVLVGDTDSNSFKNETVK